MASLDLSSTLILMAVLIASLSVHEAAHAWTADRLGDPTARRLGRLSLNPLVHVDPIGTVLFPLVALSTGLPLIGWAKPVPVDLRRLPSPRRDFALVAAAGPASNLALAAAGGALVPLIGRLAGGGENPPLLILLRFVSLNVLLAVFNMVPVPPLDGGNVLAGLLPAAGARIIDRLRPWGFLILYALLLSGVLTAILRPVQERLLEVLL